MMAKELDPDNPAATAAVLIAKFHKNEKTYQDLKARNQDMTLGGLDDANDMGEYADLKNPLFIDKESYDRAKKRGDLSMFTLKTKGEKEREIERRLLAPVTLNFTNTSLRQVLEDLRGLQGINIFVDEPALQEDGISLDRPVTMKIENVSLQST